MKESLQDFLAQKIFRARLISLIVVMTILFFIFMIKLVLLQISEGKANNLLAKKFSSLHEYVVAPRGLIYDRTFPDQRIPLVQNIRYIDYVIYPWNFYNFSQYKQFIENFCKVMNKDCNEYAAKSWLNKKSWQRMVAQNVILTLMERITRADQERLSSLRMVGQYGRYVTRYMRHYTMGHASAHITGYIGRPTSNDLKKNRARAYQNIGKVGIESVYDKYLRGKDGLNISYRSANSHEQISDPESGSFVVLNIDKKVQSAAYKALLETKKRGAIIVMRPDNGAVVALATTPSYDPNILSGGNSQQRSEHLKLVNRHQAFLNVAIQGRYPPASTFKTLVLLAALEDAKQQIDREETVYCPGYHILKSTQIGVPDTRFKCWKPGGHGNMNMHNGLVHSCDVYFYNLGYRLGPSLIIEYAKTFALNRTTGIDLPGEMSGVVPDAKWKRYHFSSRWYDGDTLNLVIGQGFLTTTPLEMAVLYAAIVNRGKLYRPQIVREIHNTSNDELETKISPQLIQEIPISQENHQLLMDMMRDVVLSGTANVIADNKLVSIAGKTGTAQSRNKDKGIDHAWFIGVAPYGKPISEQLVITIFIEHGISGGAVAAPLAQKVLQSAFD